MTTRVLIVDDNRAYREAFRRNLVLRGYDVAEAEDAPEAIEKLQAAEPDVMVTDLAMRTPTEGLDLIRQAKALHPRLPVIMISAVGTFDEGAEAARLGAARVLGKARIENEIERLYEAIDSARAERARLLGFEKRLADALALPDAAASRAELARILADPEAPASVKGDAFEALAALEPGPPAPAPADAPPESEALVARAEASLREAVAGYDKLADETRANLRTAEFLFLQEAGAGGRVDFSRSMGFAYCFAVENECKVRLRKRQQKFFGDPKTPPLIRAFMDKNGRGLSLHYQQFVLRAIQGIRAEATIENFAQTFQRILEHGGRYKPDGLKALGIVLICFGREYSVRGAAGEVAVANPLGLRGLDSDGALALGGLLVNLQHYRNPYIHPELSEPAKLSQVRETAFECLRLAVALV